MYSPFVGKQHVLAQIASTNFATGATTSIALALGDQEYYTTVDMVYVEIYPMPVAAPSGPDKGASSQAKNTAHIEVNN